MRNKSSNPVDNAVGMQRQFGKQPQGGYVKRLQGLNLSTPYVGADLKGEALAQSLGVLGAALGNEAIAQQKRTEKYGIDAAEKVFAAMTDEDKQKLNAMSALSQFGYANMIDNPYAVSMLDRLRGQSLNKGIDQEFKAAVERGVYKAKTAQERAQQYEEYRKGRLGELAPDFDNEEAFYKGFNEAHPINLVSTADQFFKIKNQESLIESYNLVKASADSLTESIYKGMSPEGVKGSLAFFTNMAQGMSLPSEYLYGAYDHFLKTLAQKGLTDAHDALRETEGFTDGNGNPIKIKDAMPTEAYRNLADTQAVNRWKDAHAESYRYLEASATVEDVKARFSKMPLNMQKALEPYLHRIENGVMSRNAKLANAQLGVQVEALNEKAQITQLGLIYDALTNGHTAILNGSKNTNSTTYSGLDKKGGAKQNTWDEAVLNNFAQGREQEWLSQVDQGQLSIQEYAGNLFRLYDMPQLSKQRQERVRKTLSDLNSVNMSADQQDKDGNFIIPPQLQNVVNLYEGNKGRFGTFFGQEATRELETLRAFQQAAGDDQKGFNQWVQMKPQMDDPAVKKAMSERYTNLKNRTASLPVLGAENDWFGSSSSVNVSNDPTILKEHERLFKMFALKMSDSDASAKASEVLKENYTVYENYAIPKSFFGGIETTLAKEMLDHYKEQQGSRFGKDSLVVQYNSGTDSITIGDAMSDAPPLVINRLAWRELVAEYLETTGKASMYPEYDYIRHVREMNKRDTPLWSVED